MADHVEFVDHDFRERKDCQKCDWLPYGQLSDLKNVLITPGYGKHVISSKTDESFYQVFGKVKENQNSEL